MDRTLAVIAYPPHYPAWMFWKHRRPFLLNLSECSIDSINMSAKIMHPKKGYSYKMIDIIETE